MLQVLCTCEAQKSVLALRVEKKCMRSNCISDYAHQILYEENWLHLCLRRILLNMNFHGIGLCFHPSLFTSLSFFSIFVPTCAIFLQSSFRYSFRFVHFLDFLILFLFWLNVKNTFFSIFMLLRVLLLPLVLDIFFSKFIFSKLSVMSRVFLAWKFSIFLIQYFPIKFGILIGNLYKDFFLSAVKKYANHIYLCIKNIVIIQWRILWMKRNQIPKIWRHLCTSTI